MNKTKIKYKLLSIEWEYMADSLEELHSKGWTFISFTAIGNGNFACIFAKAQSDKK